jgi:hypothetical protein
MWDLWWTKWHWDRFLSESLVSSCQYHPIATQYSLMNHLGGRSQWPRSLGRGSWPLGYWDRGMKPPSDYVRPERRSWRTEEQWLSVEADCVAVVLLLHTNRFIGLNSPCGVLSSKQMHRLVTGPIIWSQDQQLSTNFFYSVSQALVHRMYSCKFRKANKWQPLNSTIHGTMWLVQGLPWQSFIWKTYPQS